MWDEMTGEGVGAEGHGTGTEVMPGDCMKHASMSCQCQAVQRKLGRRVGLRARVSGRSQVSLIAHCSDSDVIRIGRRWLQLDQQGSELWLDGGLIWEMWRYSCSADVLCRFDLSFQNTYLCTYYEPIDGVYGDSQGLVAWQNWLMIYTSPVRYCTRQIQIEMLDSTVSNNKCEHSFLVVPEFWYLSSDLPIQVLLMTENMERNMSMSRLSFEVHS